jgi:hypothetical protein
VDGLKRWRGETAESYLFLPKCFTDGRCSVGRRLVVGIYVVRWSM